MSTPERIESPRQSQSGRQASVPSPTMAQPQEQLTQQRMVTAPPQTRPSPLELESQMQQSPLSLEIIATSCSQHRISSPGQRSSTPGSLLSQNPIIRLCGSQGKLNGKDAGKLRYFGPTSSLHLTESVQRCLKRQKFCRRRAVAIQLYLLDLYWKYQHTVLQIIHKAAFLAGMEVGHGPYFSVFCYYVYWLLVPVLPRARKFGLWP